MLQRLVLVLLIASVLGGAIVLERMSRPEPGIADASPLPGHGLHGARPRRADGRGGACLICGVDGTLGLSSDR